MSALVAIINPQSGGGRTAAAWPDLARRLASAGLEVEARLTSGPGDATTLTRRALTEGARTVIAVGGDGTIHEVVNGFFAGDVPLTTEARLGILPAGSGSDLIRTLGIPRSADGAVAVIAGGKTRAIDLGRATFTSHGGALETRWFVNTASAGLSGAVMQRMTELPPFLKGSLRYNLASVLTMATYNPPPVVIAFDDQPGEEAHVLLMVVGNGRYFGGGMHVAPEALIDDGELDLVAIQSRPLPELLLNFPRIYAGTHLGLPMVDHGRGKRVAITGATPLLLEIDGEQPGRTPATFEVVPAALRVLTP